MKSKITFVTALLDIGRSDLSSDFSRSFERYLETFFTLLKHLKDKNLVVYIDKKYHDKIRTIKNNNIVFKSISTEDIKNTEYYNDIQKIRNDESWRNQVGWLKNSTQANLEFYNALIFQKIHFLEDISLENPFESEYFIWLDAGIANAQCHPGYFSKDWLEERLTHHLQKFLFLCFPYDSSTEIHGFSIDKMKEICKTENVNRVARATFFGGKALDVQEMSKAFREISKQSLSEGYMGTEESIFTILTYLYPEKINTQMIQSNGLVYEFFERLQNNIRTIFNKTDLYIVTYNSPAQFKATAEAIRNNCSDMFDNSNKYVINNSTDDSYSLEYNNLFREYNFKEFKLDNIGICGARQYVAEHFDTTNAEYMFFFEDDMIMNGHDLSNSKCKNGFLKYHKNLYADLLNIILNEEYDFIKLNFTEFFGDNSIQWSWYNVSQEYRFKKWPNNKDVSKHNPPLCLFRNIKSYNGLAYADGEIYYCNWPQIVSKNGNRKMFLETKWQHPYEQTWMSHIYKLTASSHLRSAILLLSPTTHNRFEHYDASERKEN